MSGHSKWSTIKREKGLHDVQRGQVFTKMAKLIAATVKQGGSADPEKNYKLRIAIDKARTVNMPKENIERILRGQDKANANVEEVVYEGFGPSGTAFQVFCLTDNHQRTVAEIRNLFERNGGSLGQTGCTSYLFRDPNLFMELDSETKFKVQNLAEQFEALDDVQEVRTNIK